MNRRKIKKTEPLHATVRRRIWHLHAFQRVVKRKEKEDRQERTGVVNISLACCLFNGVLKQFLNPQIVLKADRTSGFQMGFES